MGHGTEGAAMASDPGSAPDVFLVSAMGGAGLSRNQARGRAFVSPSAGVRQRRETVGDPISDARAALAACGPDAVATDLAAARIWGLPLPRTLPVDQSVISVANHPGGSRTQRRGTRGRRLKLPPFHVTQVDGVTVTTPVRTWLDCAPWLRRSDLVAMGDAILHRRLGTPEEFQHLLTWGYRRRGMAAVRAAVPILDGGAESPAESWVRVLFVDGDLPAPRCNVDIMHGDQWIARVDMVWVDERVIVEYDGAVHLDEGQRRRDAERLNALQAAGWRVIVLTADDLRRPRQTVALVRDALAANR